MNTDDLEVLLDMVVMFFLLAAPLAIALGLTLRVSWDQGQWTLYTAMTLIWWFCVGGAVDAWKRKAAKAAAKKEGAP